MKFCTSREIDVSGEVLWGRICNSRMFEPHRSPLFWLGLPRPVECRLLDEVGGVGARRECVAVRGRVRQEITVWRPPALLAFRLLETNLAHRIFFDAVHEEFALMPMGRDRTRITRTTRMSVRWPFWPLVPFFKVGLWQIHRYVFNNWSHAVAE